VLTPGEAPPADDEAIAGELDEDFEPALAADPHYSADSEEEAVKSSGQDDSDDDDPRAASEEGDSSSDDELVEANIAPVKPFQSLAELPGDMLEAFESLKLSILRHKAAEWSEIALVEVLAALDSLKLLASAPQ
jgi:hypothetical protein